MDRRRTVLHVVAALVAAAVLAVAGPASAATAAPAVPGQSSSAEAIAPGILMLSDEQADLAKRVVPRPNVDILIQPIKLKQLLRRIKEMQG